MKKKIEQGALLHHDGKSYRDGGKIEFLTLDLCDGLFFFTVCSAVKFIVRTPPWIIQWLKQRAAIAVKLMKFHAIWPGTISCLEFYGTSHLISGGEDGLMCVWRTKKWECLKTIKAHKYVFNLSLCIILWLWLQSVIVFIVDWLLCFADCKIKISQKVMWTSQCFLKPKIIIHLPK